MKEGNGMGNCIRLEGGAGGRKAEGKNSDTYLSVYVKISPSPPPFSILSTTHQILKKICSLNANG